MYISTSPLLTEVSFPSPAWLERGGFGNEAGVREKHGAYKPFPEGIAKAQNRAVFRNICFDYLFFRQKLIYPRFVGFSTKNETIVLQDAPFVVNCL